jgi:2-polyprenyl-3-methyl-5-hydroxy-6-metoxy-1,4-benzoquinol methylase/uncharacterized protein YbaR (Trm112 family)
MARPRLNGLFDLLACPLCRCSLWRRREELVCGRCGRRYAVIDGVPVLLPSGEALGPDAALPERNGYDAGIHRTVLESLPADAIVLEVGAGHMATDLPNVIRMDVTLTPHVDVVGDAHAAPFISDCFDFVFSLAVMEHLRQPFVAADEMFRVLRNGGYVYAECSFVFPFHGHPHHYFNASHLGMAELFKNFTPLRSGVGPHQMPSFALRALLETYLFFVGPHADADAQRVSERLRGVLSENLTGLDERFSQEAALRCAACTYFFAAKRPESTEVIPAPVLKAYQRSRELRQRFPNPFDIGTADNLLAWAGSEEARGNRAIAAHLEQVVPFHKERAPAARAAGAGLRRARQWMAPRLRASAALAARLRRTVARSAGWRVEEIIDDGERVTHLFPNDCYVAHLSIYHFAQQFIAGAAVLDAGCGAGYGAAYLAERGASSVLAIDASEKAIAFSRQHFARANLRFEVANLQRLEQLEPGAWDVIVCSNVLEHVPDVGRFLRGVWGLLSPRGVLLVAVPPIVNESLRDQNLANPYHLNIWSPQQWAYALGRFFVDVQPFQHWYEKNGVELNLINSPAETVVKEDEFVFRPATAAQLYELPTITAIFTAARPVPAGRLPLAGVSLGFIDDSFTRPPAAPEAPPSRLQRALRALRPALAR